MGKLSSIALVAALLALRAAAAPAATPPRPASPIAPPTMQPGSGATPIDPNASRYRLAQTDAFIRETWSKFAMAKRPVDPFGLSQDPNAEPPKPKLATPKKSYQNIAPTPFADIINAIRVNAVMPAKGRFLIRDVTYQKGQVIPLKNRDNEKVMQIRVEEVTDGEIVFRNVATGETANLSLNKLPPGMQRGAPSQGPPGMQRNDPSAPLEVDVPPPATTPPVVSEPR